MAEQTWEAFWRCGVVLADDNEWRQWFEQQLATSETTLSRARPGRDRLAQREKDQK